MMMMLLLLLLLFGRQFDSCFSVFFSIITIDLFFESFFFLSPILIIFLFVDEVGGQHVYVHSGVHARRDRVGERWEAVS